MAANTAKAFLYHEDAQARAMLDSLQHLEWLGVYATPGAGLTTSLRADFLHAARQADWEPVLMSEAGGERLVSALSRGLITELTWQGHALTPESPEARQIDAWRS